jgi:hypothetical protein
VPKAFFRFTALVVALVTIPSEKVHSEALPRFEDYPVSAIYRSEVKPPQFGDLKRYSGTELLCYGGDPADYTKEHVNFAGHLVISSCACGSGCHYSFLWDAATGKFHGQVPPGVINVGPYDVERGQPVEYPGDEFRDNSSLLVVDACVEGTCDCAKRFYRWDGSRFVLIMRQESRVPLKCRH